MAMYKREWGEGEPVIALHPLGLESSGFAGFGKALARRGMRTIAVDLPGFGRTPAPDAPLSPAVLAAPVIAIDRTASRSSMPPVGSTSTSSGRRTAIALTVKSRRSRSSSPMSVAVSNAGVIGARASPI